MQQVGKYQLIRKLATGGMAEVFLAKAAGPMGFEKTLVLKRILPHLAEESAFVEMFLSEAKLAAQLTHPHVVQIFDFGEANGTYFLAMEYIDGPSLRTLVKRASAQGVSLPEAVCARLVSHACEGLAFAHDFTEPETGTALELIHRDISPDNILLSKQGAVKVVDFGIAKAAGQAHRTASGVIKGKLSYMPPEQVRAESLDRRVDVYALGVVLYELLTGHKPFESESDVGLMRAILHQSPMPAVQFRPELPDSMRRILGRALAKDREQRYADCHAFQADLEEFILSVGKPVTTQHIAQLIAQVASGTESTATSQLGLPRVESATSVTPVHTPPPHEEKTDLEGADAPQTVRLRKTPAVKEEAAGVEAPQTMQLRKPQAAKEEAAGVEAPQTVQLRKSQAVKKDSPEAPSERPTDPDIRPLPPVRRPSMEVLSAQRKPEASGRGGKWAVALVACLLIAGGAGIVLWRTASSTPAPSSTEPRAKASPGGEAAPSVMPPASASLAPSTDDAGVGPQGTLDGGSAAPQDAGFAVASPLLSADDAGVGPQGALDGGFAAAPQDAGVAPIAPPTAPLTQAPAAPLQAAGPRVSGPAKPIRALKASSPKSLAKGKIEFRIRPFATVFLSGKELGDTPLSSVELPPGNYTVKLVNKDIGKTVTKSVKVESGETFILKVNLQEE